MRQKGGGLLEVKTCEIYGIALPAIRWFDNRAVTVLATY